MDQAINFDSELIKRYNVQGPRYTSYPTALQFGEFKPGELEQAVISSPLRDHDLSLYVHLPFCATLCYYCACNKILNRIVMEQAALVAGVLESEVTCINAWNVSSAVMAVGSVDPTPYEIAHAKKIDHINESQAMCEKYDIPAEHVTNWVRY